MKLIIVYHKIKNNSSVFLHKIKDNFNVNLHKIEDNMTIISIFMHILLKKVLQNVTIYTN